MTEEEFKKTLEKRLKEFDEALEALERQLKEVEPAVSGFSLHRQEQDSECFDGVSVMFSDGTEPMYLTMYFTKSGLKEVSYIIVNALRIRRGK